MDGRQSAGDKFRDTVSGLVRIPFEVLTRLWDMHLQHFCLFFVRMPSEAIPLQAGKGSGPNSIYLEDGNLVVDLHRRYDLIFTFACCAHSHGCGRKNKPTGSKLIRKCWCAQSVETCPVHVLGKTVEAAPHGHKLFTGLNAGAALRVIRQVLEALQVKDANLYRTHDFRRGHALDLQESGELQVPVSIVFMRINDCAYAGAPLWTILAAGEWKSPAFLQYLDAHK